MTTSLKLTTAIPTSLLLSRRLRLQLRCYASSVVASMFVFVVVASMFVFVVVAVVVAVAVLLMSLFFFFVVGVDL